MQRDDDREPGVGRLRDRRRAGRARSPPPSRKEREPAGDEHLGRRPGPAPIDGTAVTGRPAAAKAGIQSAPFAPGAISGAAHYVGALLGGETSDAETAARGRR